MKEHCFHNLLEVTLAVESDVATVFIVDCFFFLFVCV